MDAVWDGRLDGSRDEVGTGIGFGDRSTGRGNLGGECGVPHCSQWGVCRTAVQKCVNCRSCCLGWCMGSDGALMCQMGSTSCKGKVWEFGVFVPDFHYWIFGS